MECRSCSPKMEGGLWLRGWIQSSAWPIWNFDVRSGSLNDAQAGHGTESAVRPCRFGSEAISLAWNSDRGGCWVSPRCNGSVRFGFPYSRRDARFQDRWGEGLARRMQPRWRQADGLVGIWWLCTHMLENCWRMHSCLFFQLDDACIRACTFFCFWKRHGWPNMARFTPLRELRVVAQPRPWLISLLGSYPMRPKHTLWNHRSHFIKKSALRIFFMRPSHIVRHASGFQPTAFGLSVARVCAEVAQCTNPHEFFHPCLEHFEKKSASWWQSSSVMNTHCSPTCFGGLKFPSALVPWLAAIWKSAPSM